MEIIRAYRIDLDEVVAMIEGRHGGENAHLFGSPINLDTIEGVSRSRAFSMKSGRPLHPRRLVAAMALADGGLPVKMMDGFWKLKDEVYNLVIHHPYGLLFDGLAQSYMAFFIDEFRAEDFLKTEDQLKHKAPKLFHIFAWAKTSRKRAYTRVSDMVPAVLEYEIKAPKRTFTVNTDVEIKIPSDLKRRYTQSKEHRTVTIGALVADHFCEEATH